jgi:hypothetical protein
MLLAAILLGALTAYYFGLRAGAWAAGLTVAASVLVAFMPRAETWVHVAVAVAGVLVWRIGSRRPRPPDAVLAVRFVRQGAKRVWSRIAGKAER